MTTSNPKTLPLPPVNLAYPSLAKQSAFYEIQILQISELKSTVLFLKLIFLEIPL
ncbi:hypothetical protein NIES4071_85690 [Calothrix sp. NIES-4071]|nr:hypothetical protein NIES4071_85690 [Calothrix sp. NIES-4071]BAZ62836.1 hypothetical protein NIES4105_85620 [Calothrix sp. NIES-4105]